MSPQNPSPASSFQEQTQNFFLGFPVQLEPEKIERELALMWSAVPGEGEGPPGSAEESTNIGGAPAAVATPPPTRHATDGDGTPSRMRVCLGTVVWLGNSAALERLNSLIPAVVRRFPARLILLEVTGDARENTSVEGSVNAHCFVEGPGQPEVCCEIIHFKVGAGAVPRLYGLVSPLLLPDVDATLWLSSTSPLLLEAVPALSRLADRILYSAGRTEDPLAALETVINSKTPSYTVAWFRLAEVREQIAALFDDEAARVQLRNIRRVLVRYVQTEGSRTNELSSALIVGWLASRLGWSPAGPAADTPGAYKFAPAAGRAVDVVIEPVKRAVPGFIESVTIFCGDHEVYGVRVTEGTRTMERHIQGANSCPLPSVVATHELETAEAIGAALTEHGSLELFRAAGRAALPLFRFILARKGTA